MKLNEFKIGEDFYLHGIKYRCTDIGTRTVTCICLSGLHKIKGHSSELTEEQMEKMGWFSGPPYVVVELSFDEDDLDICKKEVD